MSVINKNSTGIYHVNNLENLIINEDSSGNNSFVDDNRHKF